MKSDFILSFVFTLVILFLFNYIGQKLILKQENINKGKMVIILIIEALVISILLTWVI